MVIGFFHEKQDEERIHYVQQDTSTGFAVLGEEAPAFAKVLRLQGEEEFAGSMMVAGVELLSPDEGRADLKVAYFEVEPDFTFSKTGNAESLKVTNPYPLDVLLNHQYSASGFDEQNHRNFLLLFHEVYGCFLAHPDYVVLDFSKFDINGQEAISSICASMMSGSPVFVILPSLDPLSKGGVFTPLTAKAKEEKKKQEDDDEHLAFDAFIYDIAGIKAPIPGEVLSPSERKTAPIEEKKPQEKPVEEKPAQAEASEQEKALLKSNKNNVIFSALFYILSIVTSVIYIRFVDGDNQTFKYICIVMTFAFLGVTLVPQTYLIRDNYKLPKEHRSIWQIRLGYFGYAALTVIYGVVLFYLSKKFSWDTKTLALSASPWAAYLLVSVAWCAYIAMKLKSDNKNEKKD